MHERSYHNYDVEYSLCVCMHACMCAHIHKELTGNFAICFTNFGWAAIGIGVGSRGASGAVAP